MIDNLSKSAYDYLISQQPVGHAQLKNIVFNVSCWRTQVSTSAHCDLGLS